MTQKRGNFKLFHVCDNIIWPMDVDMIKAWRNRKYEEVLSPRKAIDMHHDCINLYFICILYMVVELLLRCGIFYRLTQDFVMQQEWTRSIQLVFPTREKTHANTCRCHLKEVWMLIGAWLGHLREGPFLIGVASCTSQFIVCVRSLSSLFCTEFHIPHTVQ